MTLLHPWFLLAGLAVGIPLLIHWLTRPRPITLPLSTIRFVREAVQQRRARHRLRDILLLALRVLAVMLLVAAFVRPIVGARPLVPSESSGSSARVVLLDQSLGMAEAWHGTTAFERARATAARYLNYNAGARANLILAAAKPHPVVERLTSNFGALRDELSAAIALPQRLNTIAAINQAAEALASAPAGQQHELIIVSNFQRSNWANVDFSPLPKDTRIQLESVAPAETPDNVAILKVAPVGRVEQGREARIIVDIGNYSAAAREVEVELTVGRLNARLKGHCPPGVKTTLSTTIVPPDSGWQEGEARLVGIEDAIAADNMRPFVMQVGPGATFALITRESSAPRPTSSHFLERALSPFQSREGDASHGERVKRVSPDTLDRDALSGCDLIVVDHPGRLSQPQTNLLAAMLRRGRPILYVAAEPVDATNLALLAQSAGSDLKMPVEFTPPPADAARKDLFITAFQRNGPPFAAFGESVQAALSPLRFGGGIASHPVPGGLAEEVLAEYDDHSACLVSTSCAAGTLTVLNADLNESNLVSSPVFVPLLDELVDRLLSRKLADDAIACGEAHAAYLPPEAGAAVGLAVRAPASSTGATGDMGTISDDANFVLWRLNTAGPPGIYTVARNATAVFALASAPPGQSSDLTPLHPSLIKDRLAGDRTVSVESVSTGAEQRDSMWAWILVVCAACLLAELLTLKAFRT